MSEETIREFGPAMRALNERQQKFVLAAREIGGQKNWRTMAARLAGYEGTDVSLRVQAHRLANNPLVQAAIKEVALATLASSGLVVTGVLLDIIMGEIPATPSEKLKAAAMVFNRIGMPELTEHKVTVEHTLNTEDALAKLNRFSKQLGLDPQKLLGQMGLEVIDGEFSEVKQIEHATLDFSEWAV